MASHDFLPWPKSLYLSRLQQDIIERLITQLIRKYSLFEDLDPQISHHILGPGPYHVVKVFPSDFEQKALFAHNCLEHLSKQADSPVKIWVAKHLSRGVLC